MGERVELSVGVFELARAGGQVFRQLYSGAKLLDYQCLFPADAMTIVRGAMRKHLG